ncbi:hypothetical protein SAMN05216459_13818 [Ensifer sp. OV372]|nr:hypothetical protein SAMN05216459_13818 [Ensifer sp. OV372]
MIGLSNAGSPPSTVSQDELYPDPPGQIARMRTARASRGQSRGKGGELPLSGNLCEKRFDIIDKVLMIFKANAYA